MTSGFAGGDIVAISTLATKVHIAYKDAGDDYRHICEEVATLQTLIEKVAQHFKSPNINSNDRHDGWKILSEGCQSVLNDLNSLIQKYKMLVSANKSRVLTRAKEALRERLISNTGLLNGFVQRFVVPGFHFINRI